VTLKLLYPAAERVSFILEAALANLLSPPILFFVLGLFAGWVRSDLEIPDAIAKALALYLILAIGFKGGAAMAESDDLFRIVPVLLVAAALSFLIPLWLDLALRLTSTLGAVDRGAVAAHYGSVSIVTFVAATQFLTLRETPYEGYMAAVVAMMELPAIMTGLWLAGRGASEGARPVQFDRKVVREVLLNGSVVLLTGAFLIGWVTGAPGLARIEGFITVPFQGVLCLFLLDMGLVVGRSTALKRLSGGLVVVALVAPLANGVLGLLAGWALGLSMGGVMLLATLSASASYIAVPAALRLALPKADTSLGLALSLGVTFPFNLVVGIPIYAAMAEWLVGK
jgi:uncharacterized protein